MYRLPITIAVILSVLAWPGGSRAENEPGVSLRLVGPVGLVRSGDTFPVELQLDSAGQKINAGEFRLNYDPLRLEVVYITREQSIFTLWPVEPEWHQPSGDIIITGGRPGGVICQNASIATVYLRALTGGEVTITALASQTAVYLHDGLGTRLPVTVEPWRLEVASDLVDGLLLVSTTHPTSEYWSHGSIAHIGWTVEEETEYSYHFSRDPYAVPDDAPEHELGSVQYDGLTDGVYYFVIKSRHSGQSWSAIEQRRFLIDQTPPDDFTITLLPAASVENNSVITWRANDLTSGVSRTVVRVDNREIGEVTNPLTLDRSWADRLLTVTVYDAAGNSATAVWRAPGSGGWLKSWWVIGLIAAAAVAAIVVAARYWFKRSPA